MEDVVGAATAGIIAGTALFRYGKRWLTKVEQQAEKEDNAACLIQATWRGYYARKTYKSLKSEKAKNKQAVRLIQAIWKTYTFKRSVPISDALSGRITPVTFIKHPVNVSRSQQSSRVVDSLSSQREKRSIPTRKHKKSSQKSILNRENSPVPSRGRQASTVRKERQQGAASSYGDGDLTTQASDHFRRCNNYSGSTDAKATAAAITIQRFFRAKQIEAKSRTHVNLSTITRTTSIRKMKSSEQLDGMPSSQLQSETQIHSTYRHHSGQHALSPKVSQKNLRQQVHPISPLRLSQSSAVQQKWNHSKNITSSSSRDLQQHQTSQLLTNQQMLHQQGTSRSKLIKVTSPKQSESDVKFIYPQTIEVRIVSVQGLPVDSAYAQINAGPSHYETHVSKGKYAIHWNQTFELTIDSELVNVEVTILVKKLFGKDQEVGRAVIPHCLIDGRIRGVRLVLKESTASSTLTVLARCLPNQVDSRSQGAKPLSPTSRNNLSNPAQIFQM